ncbi:MAG: hypothetical protein LBB86_04870 [Oscillospiraceae bacterium]|jgi:hypothetical protein|nr:hypothetical protein [Oscillospiraceae bacterium]
MMDPNSIVSLVINGFIAAVVGAFVKVVVPYLKEKHKGAHQETLNRVLDTLVQAAEQMYGPDAGEQKYAAVMDAAAQKGVSIVKEDVEAAVLRLHALGCDAKHAHGDEWTASAGTVDAAD